MSKNAKRQLALTQKGQCTSTTWDKLANGLEGAETRCKNAKGHKGRHTDGAMEWEDAKKFVLPEGVQQLDPIWQYVVRFLFGTAATTPDDKLRKRLYEAAKEVDMGRVALGMKSAVFDLGMKPSSKVTAEAARALKKGLPCPVCKTVVKGGEA